MRSYFLSFVLSTMLVFGPSASGFAVNASPTPASSPISDPPALTPPRQGCLQACEAAAKGEWDQKVCQISCKTSSCTESDSRFCICLRESCCMRMYNSNQYAIARCVAGNKSYSPANCDGVEFGCSKARK